MIDTRPTTKRVPSSTGRLQHPAQQRAQPGVVARVAGLGAAPAAVQPAAPFQPAVEGDRGVRDDRGQGRGGDQPEAPALVDAHQNGGHPVGDEDEAVGESADPHPDVAGLSHVLEQHPADQERPGHRLGDGNGAVEQARRHGGISPDGGAARRGSFDHRRMRRPAHVRRPGVRRPPPRRRSAGRASTVGIRRPGLRRALRADLAVGHPPGGHTGAGSSGRSRCGR